MRRAITLLAGLMLTLALFLPASARSGAHGTSLPLKGWSSGHLTLNLVTGELHTWGYATPVTLMGLHTSESVGWAIPDGSGGFNVFANVTGTAANGDHLFGTLTNDLLVYTGGTGRFENATGWATGGSQNVTNVVIDGFTMTADMAGPVTGVLNLNRP